MVRLGGLIEQIRGVSYKPEDVYDKLDENSVILLRANNIKDGQLNFDDVVYVDMYIKRQQRTGRKGGICQRRFANDFWRFLQGCSPSKNTSQLFGSLFQ